MIKQFAMVVKSVYEDLVQSPCLNVNRIRNMKKESKGFVHSFWRKILKDLLSTVRHNLRMKYKFE